jgi:hypothetical protein
LILSFHPYLGKDLEFCNNVVEQVAEHFFGRWKLQKNFTCCI